MSVNFNHTIVFARESRASAIFLAEILGLAAPRRWGPFQVVATDNSANIDFMDADGEITPQHYAFLVSESEFDGIFDRVREQSLPYWADPAQSQPGEINHHDGGRGIYFEDPNGHFLQVAAVGILDDHREPRWWIILTITVLLVFAVSALFLAFDPKGL